MFTSIRKGLINLASMVTGDLPFANLTQGSALSVLGVTGNATADHASIAAASDHQVMRRSGTSVGFGAVDLAQSAARTGVLPGANGGTGYASLKAAGISYTLSTSYIDGTGTAGADGTAQTVKTIAIPANTLTQVGDSIWFEFGFRPDTGTALAATGTVNGVTVMSFTTATDAVLLRRVFILEYIDSTHANLWWLTAGGVGSANLAGFDWTASQDVDIDQNNIANNHLVVYSMIGIVRPKGVVAA
jgi:hypothetical protein